jgi:hypothetical protein
MHLTPVPEEFKNYKIWLINKEGRRLQKQQLYAEGVLTY